MEEIKVPDLGESEDAEVGELPFAVGDEVRRGDILAVLETSKVAVEVESPGDGKVAEIIVGVGDKVLMDQTLMKVELVKGSANGAEDAAPSEDDLLEDYLESEVVVLGSGPGGYAAAFRAADLGKEVIMIERNDSLGGVCLNVGCIPSKALLHAAKVISETKEMSEYGLKFSEPELNTDALRTWKNKVVGQLTNGLGSLAKKRKVKVIRGSGKFASSNEFAVTLKNGREITVKFEKAVIAAGSEPVYIPSFPNDDPRMLTSTEALELNSVEGRMLVIGGGIIGLEMATVYHEMGCKITIIEFADSLIPGADEDLVRPLHQRIEKRYENIILNSKVVSIEPTVTGMYVKYETPEGVKKDLFDQVLVAVGRRPNGLLIDADKAGVKVDERGFIATDEHMRTNVPHIYAIGDIVGQPMLAHKAAHEGAVAAENIAGYAREFDGSLIPSVAYTDPEIAWVGLTERQAKIDNIEYEVARFPWAASGRSLSIERREGVTKALFSPKTKKILGAGIVGTSAGDLISEVSLAIKQGCTASQIGHLIHPHPTLSETVGLSAEVFEKSIVDLYVQ